MSAERIQQMRRVARGCVYGLADAPLWLGERIRARWGTQGNFILAITNDPDHGRTEIYRPVFRELNCLGVRVSTAVFCTIEDDGSDLAKHCRPGETHSLADPAYRDLMIELYEEGHEIAFHGYSQVSNIREKFLEGLEIYKDIFGCYPFTYIEHGGNPTKHLPGMCKRETLAVEGMNPDSPYFIMDILRDRIGCVWAWHDLLEADRGDKQINDLFYRRDGVLFFRRSRLHRLDRVIPNLVRYGGCFIGYTHFGYNGYPKTYRYRFENWTEPCLGRAIKGLENILSRHEVINLTLEQLAGRSSVTQ